MAEPRQQHAVDVHPGDPQPGLPPLQILREYPGQVGDADRVLEAVVGGTGVNQVAVACLLRIF